MTPTDRPPLAPVPEHPRRLVYLGVPAIAVPPLEAVVAAGHDVALVVTAPDRRRGRGGRLDPTPVKRAALDHGIPVTHTVADALDMGADLGVVVAFGALIRRPILEVLPMINLHFSSLPRWRGAAPVERAILAGDPEIGVDVMALVEALDEGPIFAEATTPVGQKTLAELWDELSIIGGELMNTLLDEGFSEPVPQQGDATYAAKLTAEDRRIEWGASALSVHRTVRLGRAHTTYGGDRFLVHEIETEVPPQAVAELGAAGRTPGDLELIDGSLYVATADAPVRLGRIQPPNRAAMDALDWWRGVPADRRQTARFE